MGIHAQAGLHATAGVGVKVGRGTPPRVSLAKSAEWVENKRDEREKAKSKAPHVRTTWAPKLVSGFIVRPAARRPATQATARVHIETQKPRAWTEPRHAAFVVSRWIYGYGRYLHRSFSNLKPFPIEPVASEPSPPSIQNI